MRSRHPLTTSLQLSCLSEPNSCVLEGTSLASRLRSAERALNHGLNKPSLRVPPLRIPRGKVPALLPPAWVTPPKYSLALASPTRSRFLSRQPKQKPEKTPHQVLRRDSFLRKYRSSPNRRTVHCWRQPQPQPQLQSPPPLAHSLDQPVLFKNICRKPTISPRELMSQESSERVSTLHTTRSSLSDVPFLTPKPTPRINLHEQISFAASTPATPPRCAHPLSRFNPLKLAKLLARHEHAKPAAPKPKQQCWLGIKGRPIRIETPEHSARGSSNGTPLNLVMPSPRPTSQQGSTSSLASGWN